LYTKLLTFKKEVIMTLSAGNTKRVSEAIVRSIPEPEFTKTWHPVSHSRVIDSLQAACDNHGIKVVNKEYSITKNGGRMFGVWSLDIGTELKRYALGIRNAIDKSLGYGITAGNSVFVCDNMCFSGEFIKFRKHTSGLDYEELVEISYKAVQGAVIKMEELDQWQNSLADIYVPEIDRKVLSYDMITKGAFSPDQLTKYVKCLDEEKAIPLPGNGVLTGTTSLYAMHGAATRLMRGWNLLKVADSTKVLNSICDDYMIAKAA
jgi:hypothetical protein